MSEPTSQSKEWASWEDVSGGVYARRVYIANQPSRNYPRWVGVQSSVLGVAIYTSPDVTGYDIHNFQTTAGTAIIEASIDEDVANFLPISVLVNGVYVNVIPANSVGVLNGDFMMVRMMPAVDGVVTNGIGSRGIR